jgi:hypothetical protein
VPSETSVAHLPIVAARIAVPAVELVNGTTLLDAETTVKALIVLMVITLPVQLDADGKVTVIEAVPSQTIKFSVSPTVKLAVFVTGADCLIKADAFVWYVTPLCTTGTSSEPVSGRVAAGSSEIFVPAMCAYS